LGGFASGTIAGSLTRRYHGLLVAALKPPGERTLLATKLDETAVYRGITYALTTNRWQDGVVSPEGYTNIERFYLDGAMPVWHYAFGDALLEKCVWMEYGANTTYVRYRLLRAIGRVDLTLRALVNYRDFHGNTHAGDWHVGVTLDDRTLRVDAFDGARPFQLFADRGDASVENVWYRDFVLSEETFRGLDDRDDNLSAGTFAVVLAAGESVSIVATCEERTPSVDDARARRAVRDAGILGLWEQTGLAKRAPKWMRQCVLAADQFVVLRPLEINPKASSIIAGYPWFDDWGRDTMIALPGLTVVTGRPEIARDILLTFGSFVDGGMVPNYFPERGEKPEYNTVDASLWFVEAVGRYVEATGDRETLSSLWTALTQIVTAYRDGTRYGIHMDADGLIVTSDPNIQLTWMDAKVGDWVVTPRLGKPVEIAALWYNALRRLGQLAVLIDSPATEYVDLAEKARLGFERFWNEAAGYCYDVLDGPNGSDATLRPNQLFCVSLPNPLLTPEQQRSIVDACAAQLLTSNGMRTLPSTDPAFVGRYAGSPHDRDASYHQGTVWPWLLGAFAIAHARVYGDASAARSFLVPLADQLFDYGLGSISEIADGDAPFTPRGATAQAWSVGELIRAWHDIGKIASGGTS
jgi:predicted glycogen debranching enzyme